MQQTDKQTSRVTLDLSSWIQTVIMLVVLVGGLYYTSGSDGTKLDMLTKSNEVKEAQLKHLVDLLNDQRVDVIVIRKDVEGLSYRVSKLEDEVDDLGHQVSDKPSK